MTSPDPNADPRNRDEKIKPTVWLENVSRESKSGARSFINCDGATDRPPSADRKRKNAEKEKQLLAAKPKESGELGALRGTPMKLSKIEPIRFKGKRVPKP